MTEGTAPIGRQPFFRTPRTATNVQNFKETTKPLVNPKKPTAPAPAIKKEGRDDPKIDVDVLTHYENPANKEKMERVTTQSTGLWNFIKQHPFLSAGFVVGILLLILSFHSFAMALSGGTSLSVFDAHLVVGAGLIAMTLYYGIYLINMARRGAVKDRLLEQIRQQNELTEELRKTRIENADEVIQRINKELSTVSVTSQSQLIELQRENRVTKEEIERYQYSVERIKSYQTVLKNYYNEQLPPELKSLINDALENAAKAVSEGARSLTLPTIPGEKPEVELLETITVPDTPTEQMVQNQSKLAAVAKTLSNFSKNAVDMVTKNKGSMAFILSGLFFTALSGTAIYFWLHGSSSIFFVGPLTAFTVVPMAIYGLSLVYEGYNSSTINRLQQELNESDAEQARVRDTIAREQQVIANINKRAFVSLDDFRHKWDAFLEDARKSQVDALNRIRNTQAKEWPSIEAQCRTLVQVLQKLFPDLNAKEGSRVVMEKVEGAVTESS